MGKVINNYTISQEYGCTDYQLEWYRADCPQQRFHCGIDFACGFREPVYACSDGRVVRIGSPFLGDQAVTLRFGPYFALYGHLDQAAVPLGTDVKRGDLLGWADSKGASSGNHLHFSIRTDGDAESNPYNTVDPWPWVEWQDTPVSTLHSISGGEFTLVALTEHPDQSQNRREDKVLVGTNNQIYHIFSADGTPSSIEPWGGKDFVAVSASWTADGRQLRAVAVRNDGLMYERAVNLDGSVVYDWSPILDQNGGTQWRAYVPPTGVGPKGDKGDVGPAGPAGKDGAGALPDDNFIKAALKRILGL